MKTKILIFLFLIWFVLLCLIFSCKTQKPIFENKSVIESPKDTFIIEKEIKSIEIDNSKSEKSTDIDVIIK